jgi:hypothetical protein
MRRRPISITLLAGLYLAVGVLGFVAHFHGLPTRQPDAFGVELTEFLAIVIGIFLLRGHNWARWLALVWIAFHVAISIHDPQRLAIHAAFLVVFAWILFSAAARRWFQAIDWSTTP